MKENIFNQLKQQIDAREIVKDILGSAPKSSGENNFWNSPFRDGDSDPSLCVNQSLISDFGDEEFIGQDIFNFLVRYNNEVNRIISDKDINNFEALEWVNKEYNLGFNITNNIKSSILYHPKTITKNYSIVTSSECPISITTTFDTVKFDRKPIGNEIAEIKSRIGSQEYFKLNTIEDVKNNITNGMTCIPSGIKAREDWIDNINCMQVFMVDIDNKEKINGNTISYKVTDEKHITVPKILSYCENINLVPTFIYNTFSNSEEQHRFRLVYILEKAVSTIEEITGIYDFLKSTFKNFNIDTSATDIARVFFGGTDICYDSNKFYKVQETETVKTNPSIVDKALKGSSYRIKNNKLCFISYKKDEKKYTPISNFIPYIDEKIEYVNGQDTKITYKVRCEILGSYTSLQPRIIEQSQMTKMDFLLSPEWIKNAIVVSGRGNADKMREVMQLISRETMKEKVVYAHTGFTKIEDKSCYLYHGGIIGDVENIDVDLSKDKLTSYRLTDKKFDTDKEEKIAIQNAIKLSYSMLDIADHSITIPLIAITYLSPMYSFLKEEGILADFIIFIQGRTGCRKSSLSAAFLSHFGNFNRDSFPCSFRDTLNAIEKKSFILKDTLNVIDDYNPETCGNKKLEIIEKIYAMYGDRVGRDRMAQDTSLKNPYTARGLCIITGETVPEVAQSRIARSLILNIKDNSIDLKKLSVIQNNVSDLSFAMRKYIELLIFNEAEMRIELKNKFNALMSNQENSNHGRTAEIACVLNLGFYLFTKFLETYEIINEAKASSLLLEANLTLKELVKKQSEDIKELSPSELFIEALQQLFDSRSIHVNVCKNGKTIEEETNCYGTLIGYYDLTSKKYYLIPEIAYKEVVSLYTHSNKKFPLDAKSLWKYLREEKYIPTNGRNKVQKTIDGKQSYYIELDLPIMHIPKYIDEEERKRRRIIHNSMVFYNKTF